MAMLLGGLALFFVAHVVVSLRLLHGRLPELPRKGLVSLASIAGFVLIVLGWGGAASAGVLWSPPAWTRHVTLSLTPFALILLAAAYAPAGRIKRAAKHPMLAAVKLWALAHLVSNGEWRSIALFGGFLLYAGFARAMAGKAAPTAGEPSLLGDGIAVVAGIAAYVAVAFYLHPILFGVRVVG